MKNLKLAVLFLVSSFGSLAMAQTDLTCIYQVASSYHGLQNVILKFTQDQWGRPGAGQIRIERPNGSQVRIPLAPQDIQRLSAAPVDSAELLANVHVRSYEVDLVLNYAGNEFSMDAAHWLRLPRATEFDMIRAYDEMSRSGAIYHRTPNSVAQMTGSVRGPDGVTKFASTQFVCSLAW